MIQACELAVVNSAVLPANTGPEMLSALGLTARQCDVYFLMICGKTNAEISIELSLGLDTVKKHSSAIFQRLRVDNRYAAIVAGLEALRKTASRAELAADVITPIRP